MTYQLQENAKLYGSKTDNKFKSSIVKFAKKWADDFNPSRWTYKTKISSSEVSATDNDDEGERTEIREFDLALVHLAEAMSGMMKYRQFSEIEEKIRVVLLNAISKTLVDGGNLYS